MVLFKLLQLLLKLGFVKICSVEHGEGPEEVAGAAALVGVADELRVELLVPFQRDASLLLVILLEVISRRQVQSDNL